MVNRGQLTQARRTAKIIAVAAVTAALTLTATTATAAESTGSHGLHGADGVNGVNGADGINGTVSGITTLTSVACPTGQACVTVGYGDINSNIGKSAIINATTGTAKAWTGGLTNEVLNAVACVAKATSCLTVANDAVASVSVATGAMKITAIPKPPKTGIMAIGSIACASTTACYAVGFQGSPGASNAVAFHLSAAGKVLGKATSTGKGVATIACPAATRCLISDNEASGVEIQLLNSGKFGMSSPLPANTYIQEIRCYKASLCYALGGNTQSPPPATDELFPLNPTTGVPGSMITIPGFSGTGLTCISATTCLVVGFTGSGSTAKPAVTVVTNGTPGIATNYPGKSLSSVACATASLCYAVGLGSKSAIVDKVAS